MIGLVGGGLVVAIAVGLILLPGPEDTPLSPSNTNSELYAELASAGIVDAVVDVTEDRVLIRSQIPPGTTRAESVEVILTNAAAVAPQTETIIVQLYEGDEPVEQLTVETAVVTQYNLEGGTFANVMERVESTRSG